MKQKDLKVGDIIFFVRDFSAYDEDREKYYDHVAMVTDITPEGKIFITHAFQREDADLTKPDGLCITTLRPLINRTETYTDPETSEVFVSRYDVEYQVVRPQDEKLAMRAAQLIKQWAQYRIPYDEGRLQKLMDLEEETFNNDAKFAELAQESYTTHGLWRAIKFACRRNNMITQPREDGNGKGLMCTMAVILAYQVAELEDRVMTLKELGETWVSDKYGREDLRLEFSETVRESYNNYQQHLRTETDHAPEADEIIYTSSIAAWKPSEQYPNPTDFRSAVFTVDSKLTGVGAMFHYMTQVNHKAWLNFGIVSIEEYTFNSPERRQYRAKRARLAEDSFSNTRSEIQFHSSPRGLPCRKGLFFNSSNLATPDAAIKSLSFCTTGSENIPPTEITSPSCS